MENRLPHEQDTDGGAKDHRLGYAAQKESFVATVAPDDDLIDVVLSSVVDDFPTGFADARFGRYIGVVLLGDLSYFGEELLREFLGSLVPLLGAV